MATGKKIDVGYLEKHTDAYLVSAATNARQVKFQVRTPKTHFSVTEIKDGPENLEYTVKVSKGAGDLLERITFPFGAINVQLLMNDCPIKVVDPKEGIQCIEFETPVFLVNHSDIKVIYRLDLSNFSGESCALDHDTAYLGAPSFEYILFTHDEDRPLNVEPKDVAAQLSKHFVE